MPGSRVTRKMLFGKKLLARGQIANPKVCLDKLPPCALLNSTHSLGPESLSLDIDFPHHGHVYGIPQHAPSLYLPTTTGEDPFFSDPYRFYNADVFEYLASGITSLYGTIP